MLKLVEMTGFSSIKTLHQAIAILKAELPLFIDHYSSEDRVEKKEIDRDFSIFCKFLKRTPFVRTSSEREREILAQILVMQITDAISTFMNRNLIVTNNNLLYLHNDSLTITGFLDFAVCEIENFSLQNRILTIFETKRDVAEGAGQLILELAAVYVYRLKKTYGIVTSVTNWQVYCYYELDGKRIIEVYPEIILSLKGYGDQINRNDFERLYQIIYDLISQSL